MKNYLSAFTALAIAAGMVGCAEHDKTDETNRTVQFESLTAQKVFILEDTAQEFGRDTDIAFRDSASVILPEVLFGFDVEPLRSRILELAFDTVCADPAEAMGIYFEKAAGELGYQTEVASDSANIEEADGFAYINAAIYSLNNHRLTYSVSSDTYYPGAAHGMRTRSFITYDLVKGRIVTLENLFTPEGLELLPSLISKRAKRLEQQLGPTNITSLPCGGDFFVSLEDEIVFVYQPYEVASYAQGMIYVPFYPYELSEYLTPDGLEFFGLNDNIL